VRGRFVNSRSEAHRKVKRSIIGAMTSSHVMEEFTPGTLVITPGDREDIILAALSSSALMEPQSKGLTGVVLSGDMLPHPTVLNLIAQSALPVIASPMGTYAVANAIHSMTIKTLPGDFEKIHRIQEMVEQHIDVDRLLEKIGVTAKP
jgi:BioD-like phosphotransacetylase family protein